MRTFRSKDASATVRRTLRALFAMWCICIFAYCACSESPKADFTSIVGLAIQNSPRVRAAALDLKKAQQNLAIGKDIFYPSIVTGGGLGWSYGITTTVPTIFTVNAQSLIYSNQQRFTIRAARAEVEAAQFALLEARQQAEEDAAITFIALGENESVRQDLAAQLGFASKLVSILEDRVRAGLDSELELNKARRGALQMELQGMQADDDRDTLLAHLATLTGLPTSGLGLALDSIPPVPDAEVSTAASEESYFVTPGVRAIEASARAKTEHAKGEENYTWRPIINFAAQYGRISPINDVSSFYNLHGNYNTANVGVVFSFPMFDRVRKDVARAAGADAARARLDLENQQGEESAERVKMRRSIRQIAVRAKIAEIDFAIAQDELKAMEIQLHGSSASSPPTPQEEQQARIQERQKHLELLSAQMQLSKARIALLRQTGKLDGWLHSRTSGSVMP